MVVVSRIKSSTNLRQLYAESRIRCLLNSLPPPHFFYPSPLSLFLIPPASLSRSPSNARAFYTPAQCRSSASQTRDRERGESPSLKGILITFPAAEVTIRRFDGGQGRESGGGSRWKNAAYLAPAVLHAYRPRCILFLESCGLFSVARPSLLVLFP